jgi:hypothetical protein
MLFFVILAGVSDVSPLNKTYFLSADTSGITGARDRTQWTYFYMCGPGNDDCSGAWPAPPFGWAWDANPTNAPAELVGDHGSGTTSIYYYYMWRFGWVLYLMSLLFAIISFFTGFMSCLGRLGSALAGFSTAVTLFFYSIAVSLMTAVFIKARDAFSAADRDAEIGIYAFGFSWGAWAALFLALFLFCVGIRDRDPDYGGGGPSFRRNKSVRSRRSYDMEGRRVKDDYA